MIEKEWRKLEPPPPGFAEYINLPEFQAHLLYNRGVREPSDVDAFLHVDSHLLNDPMLLPDMDCAVERLKLALANNERIGIFGDFDADGITGTALITIALRDLGGDVVPYLPNRVDEGHGLNDEAVRYLADVGVSLLITVDCGVTSAPEVKIAESLGIDTIITDHHTIMPNMPKALAIIDPKRDDSEYPYGELTGVGMTFKLAEALYANLGKPWPEHLLELAALGTVADVGPLTGENRYIVKRGVELINSTRNAGLRALAQSAKVKLGSVTTESLSFGLIPRLNVAGRLDHPGISLDLLTTTDSELALQLAEELSQKNVERQALTAKGVQEAIAQIESASDLPDAVPSIIVVGHESWIPGILGLIAAKLVDTYYRPVVALNIGEDESRASARSIPEFNIVEALSESADLFSKFGGHAQAAGFTLPTADLSEVKSRLESRAEAMLEGQKLAPGIVVECEVSPGIFARNMAFIESLAPFGEANPSPVFLTRNASVLEARQVGAGGSHLKMKVAHDGAIIDAIAFRQGDKIGSTRRRIDIVYNIGIDTWGYRPKLQMTVLDFHESG